MEKSLEATTKRNLELSYEVDDNDLAEAMEENDRLKEENETLQQRLAELSLQMATVSETVIGGRKIKASRLDSLQ